MRRLLLALIFLDGCVAINSAFEDTDASTSAGSTAGGGAGAGPGATSRGDGSTQASGASGATGQDSVAVTGDTQPGMEVTTDDGTSDTLSSFDVGRPGCTDAWQEIDEDAFLVRCEGCANSNYGATEEHFVGEGKPMTGVLLLRPPQPVQPVSGAELLVHVVASGVIAGEGFELTVSAVSPPCDWQPGDEDGVPLPLGESGVTWNNCDATPDGPILWGDDGSVWTHPDPAWAEVS